MAFSGFGAKPPTGGSLFGQTATTQPSTSLFGQQAQGQAAAGTPLFGSTTGQQPAQGTSLFGQPQGQQQPAQGTSLFGQPAAQQPASTNLFGQPATNTQSTTNLFGQPATNTQQQSTGTNLFGQPATGTQQPASGTSLFGQPAGGATTQQPTGTSLFGQPAGGTNLFGQAGNTTGGTTQQPTGSSLFGQTGPQQSGATTSLFGQQPTANAQPGTTSLFGQSTIGGSQQPAAGTTSLFGQSANTQQQQQQQPGLGSSLFGGGGAQQTQSSLFGSTTAGGQTGGLFGGAAPALQQRQSTLSGFGAGASTTTSLFGKQPSAQPTLGLSTTQPTGSPGFTKATKFNDLPDDARRLFEDIETYIQGRVQISNDLKQRKLGDEATKGQEVVRTVHKDIVSVITDLQSDAHHTKDLKAKVDQTVQDTIVATRIIEGFKNPQQNGAYLKNYASFPLEFFHRVTEDMRGRLKWYRITIEQIERKLASAANQNQSTPQAITSTLEAQHATFMALANKTAALHEELQKVKALYTQLWRAKTGSMRDPFNELDRGTGGDFGLESLSGK